MCVRRPHEYSPQIQPILQTPVHGSLPSGHSTEAYAVARVLNELVLAALTTSSQAPQLREQFTRQAARIAINRTIAGLHYPIDSIAGQLLGLTMASYLVQRANADLGSTLPVKAWKFDGPSYSTRISVAPRSTKSSMT